MINDFQSRLQEELAANLEPGLGSLLEDSRRQGKRIRTTRMIYRTGVAGAVAALITGVVVANPLANGPVAKSVNPAGHSQTKVNSDATPTLSPTPTATKMAPTTPEGLLTLLLDDLPAGKTSHYAKSDPSVKGKKGWQYEDMAQVYLDSGKGPGMVRLFVAAPEPKVPKMTPAQQKQRDAIIASVEKDTVPGSLVTTKSTLPDGRQVTVNLHKGNCIAGLQVSVARENGWSVLVQVSTCLAWNGTANKPGRAALTQEQALKIAADPRIGTTLPAEAVAQGAKDFPHLPIAG